jgi:3-dehydroquinate synthase
VRHGEAVAIGMVYAAKLAHRIGLCGAKVPDRVEKLVRDYGLPSSLSVLKRRPSVTELMDAIQVDKKAESGRVRLVLPKKVGEVVMTGEWDEQQLRVLLAE